MVLKICFFGWSPCCAWESLPGRRGALDYEWKKEYLAPGWSVSAGGDAGGKVTWQTAAETAGKNSVDFDIIAENFLYLFLVGGCYLFLVGGCFFFWEVLHKRQVRSCRCSACFCL